MSALLRSFRTSAELAAYVFDQNAIGRIVYDLEAGTEYLVIAEGIGLAALFEFGSGGAPSAHATSHEDGGSDEIDITTLGGYSGDADDVLHGDGSFSPASASVGFWDARGVPAGLHSSSDEFTSNSLASWTLYEHTSYPLTTTINTTQRRMEFSATGNGVLKVAGRYKAVPSNEFTVMAQLGFDTAPANGTTQNPILGLGVLEDGASSAGNWMGAMKHLTTNGAPQYDWQLALHESPAHNSLGSAFTVSAYDWVTAWWCRLRVLINPGTPRTDVWYDYSTDGLHWVHVFTRDDAYAAQHVGPLFATTPNGTLQKAYVSHYRVFDGVSSFYGTQNGALV